MRALIYYEMPEEEIEVLVSFIREFETIRDKLMIYRIQTLNNISIDSLHILTNAKYDVRAEQIQPHAILLRSANLNDEPLSKHLLAIGRAGSGTNNIPVDYCSNNGIVVFNAPGANSNAVKELTIAGILISARNISHAWNFISQLDGDEETIQKRIEKEKKQFKGFEISGKTLGIIGLGAIGLQVARAAVHLGMNVEAYDPQFVETNKWQLSPSINLNKKIENVLISSDFVTIHIPLNTKTINFFDISKIALMKDGATLLNMSRGEVVDTRALNAALSSNKLHAYVTDFPNKTIIDHPKAIILPHIGASTIESEILCVTMVAESVRDFLENGNIRNSVNFPDIEMPRGKGERISIANQNIAGVVSNISSVLAHENINLENLQNKSRGNYAYTLIDVDRSIKKEIFANLQKINGVLSVRILPTLSDSSKENSVI